jgi:large subunit ribosomal protein L15
MKLNEISDNPGARTARKRLGRGLGSGLGKTAGRGTKGQKARRGVAIKGFEGGQMPIYRRLPRRGFTPLDHKSFQVVNLGRLQKAIEDGRLDASAEIDEGVLVEAGLIRRKGDPVKLLGKGAITAALRLSVAAASKSAVAAIEAAGGSVTVTAVVSKEAATDAAEA